MARAGGGFRLMHGDRYWRKEATWSSMEWRAELLRTADGGRDKVADDSWGVACCA
jgi:hypothetical protein